MDKSTRNYKYDKCQFNWYKVNICNWKFYYLMNHCYFYMREIVTFGKCIFCIIYWVIICHFRYPDNRSEFLLEPAVTPSEMRMNPMYSIYYINPATFVVLGILPLILLAYWNFNIYKQIKSVSSWAEQNASRPSRSHQENELARVLIGIVITFVCCHALRILLNFHEAITIKDIMACHAEGKEGIPLWPQITNEFSKLMLVTNSSANIIIYCCLNSNFRKNIMSCLKQRGDSSNEASTQHATGKNLTKVATTYCWSILESRMITWIFMYHVELQFWLVCFHQYHLWVKMSVNFSLSVSWLENILQI